jgi:hypothetical protein
MHPVRVDSFHIYVSLELDHEIDIVGNYKPVVNINSFFVNNHSVIRTSILGKTIFKDSSVLTELFWEEFGTFSINHTGRVCHMRATSTMNHK